MPAGFLMMDVQKSPGNHWQIIDNEHLNRDILQILLSDRQAQPIITDCLCGLTFKNACATREPYRGLFDLMLIEPEGRQLFIEMKIWNRYKKRQIGRQIEFLQSRSNAHAVAVLLGCAGSQLCSADLEALSGGLIRKASYGWPGPSNASPRIGSLIHGLALVVERNAGSTLEVRDLARCYHDALTEHRKRLVAENRAWGNHDC